MRQYLRRSTQGAHQALDRELSRLDLKIPSDYARFLRCQLLARRPIERWVRRHAPASLVPPAQVLLIEDDLRELDMSVIQSSPLEFEAPAEGAFGVAWAIAGSSLGNRTMLRALEKAGLSLPMSFLADAAMPEFFGQLRQRLESAAADKRALAAAKQAALAVFASFSLAASKAECTFEIAA